MSTLPELEATEIMNAGEDKTIHLSVTSNIYFVVDGQILASRIGNTLAEALNRSPQSTRSSDGQTPDKSAVL